MSWTVFCVVLLAAALHALWNALVKGGADKSATMGAMIIGQAAAGAVFLPLAQLPTLDSLPWLALGLLLHLGYQLFLMRAYRIGDFTRVYPIARGTAPLLVALGSWLFFGIALDEAAWGAIALLSLGVISISLARGVDGALQTKAVGLALVTAGFIAAYSIVDGYGARIAGTALGFYGWLAALNGVAYAAIATTLRPGLLRRALAERRVMAIGGTSAFVAYAMVVWAFTQAPIALVTALRETSVVFALLIAVFFLGERFNPRTAVSIAITLSGAVLLRLATG